ncbi:MAG: hypothetical protein A4E60_03362 [Syntrophorhabdus sp. PtaB.Bin047]|nr:MAG: hypothetical protein A4E60_03362 [Syntrophorhabdus sp. PtaB.Bin047]
MSTGQTGADGYVRPCYSAVVQWQDVVSGGFRVEQQLKVVKFFRIFAGNVDRLAEILRHVIELPGIAVNNVLFRVRWITERCYRGRAGHPAVMVNAAHTEHFEILGPARGRRSGVVEGIEHAYAFNGFLRHSVDRGRLLDAGCLQYRRYDVDDVVPLRPDAALLPDARGPGNDHAVGGAAVMRGVLLCVLERCVHGMRPGHRVVIMRLPRAQVALLLLHLFQALRDTIQRGYLVERTPDIAFNTGAVVAANIDDQSVIELPHPLNGVEDTADIVVCLREKARVHLHHVGKKLLLLGAERIPGRQFGVAFRELGVGRDDAQFLLPRQGLLTYPVPALVEPPLVLRYPLFFRVMRRVGGPGGIVEEERFVRCNRLLVAHPFYGLVRHVIIEVVVRFADVGLDGPGAFKGRRSPLICLSAYEPVKMLEPEARGPEVEGPGLARLPVRHVVVLPEPGGVPALLLEDLGDRRGVPAHQAVVARETRCHFHDGPGMDRMVVTAGEQRRARG